ncbi:MAG: hypothetical protein QUS35_06445 [bacterium]|nr:hypothetical protein [bacterium]
MNRLIPAALCLAAAALLLDCSRDEPTGIVYAPDTAGPKRLIRAGQIRFSYDDQGRLSGVDSIRTISLSRSYEFVYDSDRLIRENIRYRYDGTGGWENRSRVYEYDGNGRLKIIRDLYERYPDGELVSRGGWNIKCDTRGRVTAYQRFYTTGNPLPEDEFVYYLNGNLYEWRTGFTQEGDSVIPLYDRTYEYDRGKNPFPARIGDREIFPRTDENNPVKITEISREGGRIRVTVLEYEYTYDDSGYPIHSLWYVNGSLAGETDYEYEPVPAAD